MAPSPEPEPGLRPSTDNRRRFLIAGGATAAGALGLNLARTYDERGHRAAVFIGKARSYGEDLSRLVADGLQAVGLDRGRVKGKSILLKPNLVEPTRSAPQINTHPAVILAAARAFLRLGAREVVVAEGAGHCRDSELVLDESGLGPILADERIAFVDLNHDDVFRARNRLGLTALDDLWLPGSIRAADLVVSMPKLKTHHWAGVTLSMKNLFGLLPGVCYGWPKNVLHHQGIDRSILDIAATARVDLAIVDGLVGMEGDGPILGTAREAGLLVVGANLPAVDATCCRLMGIDPWRIAHLAGASGRLGPISARHIDQRGEPAEPLGRPFELPEVLRPPVGWTYWGQPARS